jgi:ABC-type glutathione transport system ATPase component
LIGSFVDHFLLTELWYVLPLYSEKMSDVPQILVTHHLELVLPGAGYLVRMLDGRIDTQGSVSELRSRGILQEITAKAKAEVKADAKESTDEAEATEGPKETKKAKKLVEEEERAEGRVKLSIYIAYLKAL